MSKENKVAPKNTVAWMAEDGRVQPASAMDTAERAGGAFATAMRDYPIPLVRASEAALRIAELERQRDNLLRRQGETSEQVAARRRARIDAAQARGETPPRDPAPGCGGYFDPLWLDADDDSPLPTVGVAPGGWKLVPIEPTPEIIAGAAVAVWPTATLADIDLGRRAAPIVLMSMDAPGVTADELAAVLATMAPAYRAMVKAAPEQLSIDSEPVAIIHNSASVIEMDYLPAARKMPSGSHKVYLNSGAQQQAGALTDEQINYMGELWDGCIYDGIDIGAAVRADLKNLDALMAASGGDQ